MNRLNPWVVGGALGLTVGVFYGVCAAALALWPVATVNFFNAWVHGIDLRLLVPAGGRPITWVGMVCGLTGVTLTAFLFGALYAWIHNRLAGCARPPKR